MRSSTRTVTYFLWSPLSANPIPIRTSHAFTAGRAAAWWMGLLQTEQWNNYSCAPSLSALFSKSSLFKKEKGPITQSINDQLSNCCTCVHFHISRVKKKKKIEYWRGWLIMVHVCSVVVWRETASSELPVITLTAYNMLTGSSCWAESTDWDQLFSDRFISDIT